MLSEIEGRKMRIGILQTGHVLEQLVARHGEYPAMFEQLLGGRGFEFETFAVVDGNFPSAAGQMDGWLITGSRHGAYEAHAWIPPLEELIRDAFDEKIPMVGICFGHQIMAQALGGKVEKFKGGWGVGLCRYQCTDGSEIGLHAMHRDQVVSPPPDARTILRSDFCRYAGFAYGKHAISIQPHPEFSSAYTADLILARRGGVLPVGQADAALASLDREPDSELIAEKLSDFLENARQVTLHDR